MMKFFLTILLSASQIYFSQTLSFKDISLKAPPKFMEIKQEQLDAGKALTKSDTTYSKVMKLYDEKNISWNKSFYFKNLKCNCINTFQVSSEKYNNDNDNKSLSEKNNATTILISQFNEILNQNINKLKQAKISTKINIEPKIIKNINNVNLIYNQVEYEIKKPSTNILTKYVTDSFTLIHNGIILESVFNTEKNNYKELISEIQNYKDSVKIK
ncbi:hypothetical protein [Chryseobacterium indoltheticum]|uniref:hypothetical protein n=1 Tax=Chryseobacterium indoltheticum TaxID=254 RepID=UPI0028E8A50E|nr:hypothetical protein [Chryseobacterium indoltheticum]